MSRWALYGCGIDHTRLCRDYALRGRRQATAIVTPSSTTRHLPGAQCVLFTPSLSAYGIRPYRECVFDQESNSMLAVPLYCGPTLAG